MAGNNKEQSWLFITLVAAAVLMVVMGARQSLGLFLFPLNSSTGLGILTISFAMAINQFVWGALCSPSPEPRRTAMAMDACWRPER